MDATVVWLGRDVVEDLTVADDCQQPRTIADQRQRAIVVSGTAAQAGDNFKKVSQIIDKTAQKGVIHKNQAARRKSRMSAKLKAMKLAAKAG